MWKSRSGHFGLHSGYNSRICNTLRPLRGAVPNHSSRARHRIAFSSTSSIDLDDYHLRQKYAIGLNRFSLLVLFGDKASCMLSKKISRHRHCGTSWSACQGVSSGLDETLRVVGCRLPASYPDQNLVRIVDEEFVRPIGRRGCFFDSMFVLGNSRYAKLLLLCKKEKAWECLMPAMRRTLRYDLSNSVHWSSRSTL